MAYIYRYFGNLSYKNRTPIKEVAKRMNITGSAVIKLLQRFRKVWPGIAPRKQPDKETFSFNEERDSEPKMRI
jgi:hypothetical protein